MKKIILSIVDFFCRLGLIKPILIAKYKFLYKFHRWPDFKNPRDLNEKINRLKFYGDTRLWSDLSDKYKVREYIKSKGLSDILVKLYGKWEKVDDINWAELPTRFVMKVNNGCGDVLICQNKQELQKDTIIRQYSKLLKKKYGLASAEPHYSSIKPCVIIEELLDITKQSVESSSLIDYKIWCINGMPKFIFCSWNRTQKTLDCRAYDLDWNYHKEFLVFGHHIREGKEDIPKPDNLARMLNVAKVLSEGFPAVRVDLYNVDGKIYFGEMTFTSLGGFMDYFTPELLLEMGMSVKI